MKDKNIETSHNCCVLIGTIVWTYSLLYCLYCNNGLILYTFRTYLLILQSLQRNTLLLIRPSYCYVASCTWYAGCSVRIKYVFLWHLVNVMICIYIQKLFATVYFLLHTNIEYLVFIITLSQDVFSLIWNMFRESYCLYIYISVSYTHLDVYKRQVYDY